MSWDPTIATSKFSESILNTVWSPCSRLIACTVLRMGIQILDAVTLKQLKTFIIPEDLTGLLVFSPKSHMLTWFGNESEVIISWDLQTGVIVSEIPISNREFNGDVLSITYSGCETMFGVLSELHGITTICTYSVLSSAPISSHQFEGSTTGKVWTHGECLQLAIFGLRVLTIWEVGFASKSLPTEAMSLPTPGNYHPLLRSISGFHFLPILSWLAFIRNEVVFVWDAQHSKYLLKYVGAKMSGGTSFSPDGCFFACGTNGQEVYLWKKSPTGYILHQKLRSTMNGYHIPLLSPNGQSIVESSNTTLQLWHTEGQTTSPSSIPTHCYQHFIVGFSPHELLAVTAQHKDNIATVLSLKSGVPLGTIDAGMEIYGLQVAGSTIIIVGFEKMITWNLPIGNDVVNVKVTINDSIQTTILNHPPGLHWVPAVVIPHDSSYIVMQLANNHKQSLNVFDVSTGKCLAHAPSAWGFPWLTPDGHEVWCRDSTKSGGWQIVKDGKSNVTKLERLDPARGPSGRPPWESPNGYQITDDGSVLSPSGKQLLWLPPHWRVRKQFAVWGGQFLGLLHPEQLEVVILEFPRE